MTRAEEIARTILNQTIDIPTDQLMLLLREITNALEDQFDTGYAEACQIVHARAFEQGASDMRERAAKVAEATNLNVHPECGRSVARTIRALRVEEEK